MIYRVFEGYLPPLSWRTRAKRRYWCRIKEQQLRACELRSRAEQAGLTPDEQARYDKVRLWLSSMPAAENYVLPTRFGNAIKAFETFPEDVYGVDAVTVWLRLLPVVSKEYADAVEQARTDVDFHIGCCTLALLLALLALGVALLQTPFDVIATEAAYAWHLTWQTPVSAAANRGLLAIWLPLLALVPLGKLLGLVAASVAARLFYGFAVAAVPTWGELVIAGFDCYLPKLAEQLGFTLPKNDARRREFWSQFSAMATYQPLCGEPPFFKVEDWLFPPRH